MFKFSRQKYLKFFLCVFIFFNRYLKVYNDLQRSPEVKEKIREFNNLMEITSKYTGHNITNILGLGALYNTLYAQSLMGLRLPEWTQGIFPDGELLNATLLFFDLFSYDQLNNLNGGMYKYCL